MSCAPSTTHYDARFTRCGWRTDGTVTSFIFSFLDLHMFVDTIPFVCRQWSRNASVTALHLRGRRLAWRRSGKTDHVQVSDTSIHLWDPPHTLSELASPHVPIAQAMVGFQLAKGIKIEQDLLCDLPLSTTSTTVLECEEMIVSSWGWHYTELHRTSSIVAPKLNSLWLLLESSDAYGVSALLQRFKDLYCQEIGLYGIGYNVYDNLYAFLPYLHHCSTWTLDASSSSFTSQMGRVIDYLNTLSSAERQTVRATHLKFDETSTTFASSAQHVLPGITHLSLLKVQFLPYDWKRYSLRCPDLTTLTITLRNEDYPDAILSSMCGQFWCCLVQPNLSTLRCLECPPAMVSFWAALDDRVASMLVKKD